jgi:hypothetical protein
MEPHNIRKTRKPSVWRTTTLIVFVLIVIGFAIILLKPHGKTSQNAATQTQTVPIAFDPLNATYIIDGAAITLVDGKATIDSAPGSAEKTTTQIFGQPTVGDINGDGKNDAAVILIQTTGGSGTFYYAAAALNTGHGTVGTNAIFLGDRIAPQTMNVMDTIVTVNYADRGANEPMSTAPSIGISKYLVLGSSTLYDAPINEVYPLSPGANWGEKKMTTIMPGEENITKPLIGITIESQPIINTTNITATSLPFETYYEKKLAAAGWVVDNTLAAGGPGAEIVGYKKGTDYIILRYTSVFKNKGNNSPETCPCDITLSLFAGSLE